MSVAQNIMASLKGSILFPALVLGSFSLVAGTLLTLGNEGTKEAIVLRLEEDLQRSIGQVVPDGLYDNNLLEDTLVLAGPGGQPLTVYQGRRGGAVSALAFTVSRFGYSGKIMVIMGVTPQGELLGVRILTHSETPGLGDKIEAEKDDWILGFDGLSLGRPVASQWAVKKDGGAFDQFSGATITPRAVVRAVKDGLQFFEANKAILVKPVEQKSEDVNQNG